MARMIDDPADRQDDDAGQTTDFARVAALAERWSTTPDYAETEYDRGRVDQRHAMTSDLLAVLPSEGSAEFVICSCEPEENDGCEARRGSTPEACSAIEPTLPHGPQPTERQWQIAEALDNLVMSHGVVLDDDRLDWMVDWVENRQSEALVEAADLIEKYAATFDAGDRRDGIDATVILLRLCAGRFGVNEDYTPVSHGERPGGDA